MSDTYPQKGAPTFGVSQFRAVASLICLLFALAAIVIGYFMGSYFSLIPGSYTPGQDSIKGLSRAYNAQRADRSQLTTWSAGQIGVRVLCQNVRYKNSGDYGWRSWARRASAVTSTVADTGADIVGFQEVLPDQYADLKATLDDTYDSVYAERAPSGGPSEGVPIFYRRSAYRLLSTTTKWLSATPDRPGSKVPGAGSPRIVTIARLQHRGSGRTLTVLNTHLDNVSREARALGARLIAKLATAALGDGPILITGDLNSFGGVNDAVISILLDGVPGLVDTLSVADPAAADATTFHGFRGVAKGGGRIDFIFAASPVQGVSVARAWIHARRYNGVLPSDHYGVVADLRL